MGSNPLKNGPTRGIICDTGGELEMKFLDGTTDTITLSSNVVYPFCITQISDAGSASGIHALR